MQKQYKKLFKETFGISNFLLYLPTYQPIYKTEKDFKLQLQSQPSNTDVWVT